MHNPVDIFAVAENERKHRGTDFGIPKRVSYSEPITAETREKKIRDKPFLIAFGMTIVILIVIGCIAFLFGEPARHIHGVDSWGNICGRVNTPIQGVHRSGVDQTSRPLEFRFISNDIRVAVDPLLVHRESFPVLCLSECVPTTMYCKPMLENSGYLIETELLDKRMCRMLEQVILPQREFFGGCFPKNLKDANVSPELLKALQNYGLSVKSTPKLDIMNAPGGEEEAVSIAFRILLPVLWRYWIDVILLCLISFGVTIVIIILIQFFGRFLLVASVFLSGIATTGLAGFCWFSYAVSLRQKNLGTGYPAYDFENSVQNLNLSTIHQYFTIYSFSQIDYMLPICITLTAIAVVLLAGTFFLWEKIYLSISFFDETATYSIVEMPLILLQPLVSVAATLAVITFCVYGVVYLYAYRDLVIDEDQFVTNVARTTPPVEFPVTVLILGCMWLLEFISGCQDVIIAGALCRWYFSRDRRRCSLRFRPIWRPVLNLCLYSLGSVAQGSLVINIVQFIRLVSCRGFRNVSRTDLRQLPDPRDCGCCPPEKMDCISRVGYICVAMYGKSFYKSCWHAYALVLGHRHQLMVLNTFSGLSLFLMKIVVVLISLFIAILWFQTKVGDFPIIQYALPLAIVLIVAYVIASSFLNVYVIAFDAIFLCYCVDERHEMHRGDHHDNPKGNPVKTKPFDGLDELPQTESEIREFARRHSTYSPGGNPGGFPGSYSKLVDAYKGGHDHSPGRSVKTKPRKRSSAYPGRGRNQRNSTRLSDDDLMFSAVESLSGSVLV